MRLSVMPKSGLPIARIAGAALLASVATGCSSDASRFGSLFNEDTLTTASIGNRNITGLPNGAPVPSQDVASAAPSSPNYTSRQQAVSQPYPAAPSTYQQADLGSPARQASDIQRSELAAPTVAPAAQAQPREAALAQPFPSAPSNTSTRAASTKPIVPADAITTGSTPPSAARNSVSPVKLPTNVPVPAPERDSQQNVAVLPSPAKSRDKQQALAQPDNGSSGAAKGKGGGTYTVVAGDSLGKIANANGVSVDALKAANGLSSSNIRIGQTLRMPGAAAAKPVVVVASAKPAPEPEIKTASVPAKTVKSQPASYTPPQKEETVKQVAAIDTTDKAPATTGIGKYRWPVTGAIIAKYGQNVGGKRNDGIDISVPEGTPVKAAENGVVIYAGNGLKELGNTVLVRHDDGTVTVYGHADKLDVSRGQKVQRGQQIATSGMSGNTQRPQLHFEVRKDATPVDPMTFLD